MSRAVCILGAHRSGTSLLARLVNLLGAYLGEEGSLMRPSEDNPAGYWERTDVYDFHERVLGTLAQSWDTSHPLPGGWHATRSMRPFRKELRHLIETQFGHRELWAFKDPRTSLLLPLWRTVLAELGVDLCCLLVLRNPLDVAKSLEKRDGFSREESYGIWFNYNLGMLEETRGLPRALVSYDRVIANWQPTLRRCTRELGLSWPKVAAPLRRELEKTIRPELRHSLSNTRDLKTEGCPLPVVELYQLLSRVAKSGQFSKNFAEKTFRGLLSNHKAYASLHRTDADLAELRSQLTLRDMRAHDLERLAESHETRLRDARASFEELDKTRQTLLAEMKLRLDRSDDELAETRRELQAEKRALAEKDALLQETSRQLAEKNTAWAAQDEKLRRAGQAEVEQTLEELKEKSERVKILEEFVREREKVNEVTLAAATSRNQALEALVTQVLASRSWRVTEPLRRATALLRAVRRKLGPQPSRAPRARSAGLASEPKG